MVESYKLYQTNSTVGDHRLWLRELAISELEKIAGTDKTSKRIAISIGNAFSRTQVAQHAMTSHGEADSRTHRVKLDRARVERNSSQSSNPKWKWKRFGYYTKDGRNAVVSIKWRLLCVHPSLVLFISFLHRFQLVPFESVYIPISLRDRSIKLSRFKDRTPIALKTFCTEK